MEGNTWRNYRQILIRVWRWLWPILRQTLGWIFIILGLLGLVLPVLQGVLFLVIGVALVGRRHWLIRRAVLVWKQFLRRWAHVQTPLIGPLGRLVLHAQLHITHQSRRMHQRVDMWLEQHPLRQAPEHSEHNRPDSHSDSVSKHV